MSVAFIDLLDSFKKYKISSEIERLIHHLLNNLNKPPFNHNLYPYFKNVHSAGPIFTDFDLDPDNVSQLKKLVNALYYAHQSFKNLENIQIDRSNIKATVSSLYQTLLLCFDTINQSYEASYLITHLDVNLYEIFLEEYELFGSLVDTLKIIMSPITSPLHMPKKLDQLYDSLKTLPGHLKKLKANFQSYAARAGGISGAAVSGIKPVDGKPDYPYVTQMGSDLHEHIKTINQYFKTYSTALRQREPGLNTLEAAQLQQATMTLLNDLEQLKVNHFLPLYMLRYIHILSNMITLTKSLIAQIGLLSLSSQEFIRVQLTQLNTKLLPIFYGLIDNIEVNSSLAFGTLSNPLRNTINRYYKLMMFYASRAVDFKTKGQELLQIENSKFLSSRLDKAYKRIDDAHATLFRVQQATQAFDRFYCLLEEFYFRKIGDLDDQNTLHDLTLHQLPQPLKEKLLTEYKVIQSYVIHLDRNLDKTILNGLKATTKITLSSRAKASINRYLNGPLEDDHIRFLLRVKTKLHHLLIKKKNTADYQITLNKQLIKFVHKQTDLTLFPYAVLHDSNLFDINETKALTDFRSEIPVFKQGPNTLITNPQDNLTANELFKLHRWYQNKHDQFTSARDAYLRCLALMRSAHQPDNARLRSEYRQLYNQFQPYLIGGLSRTPQLTQHVLEFDKQFISALANLQEPVCLVIPESWQQQIQQEFTKTDLDWKNKANHFLHLAEQQFIAENNVATPLATLSYPRIDYVIPHTKYSAWAIELNKKFREMIPYFNQSIQKELKTQSEGLDRFNQYLPNQLRTQARSLPYPELQDPYLSLTQSKQILVIKQLFNSLYELEQAALQLEALNNKSFKITYVYHLIKLHGHAARVIRFLRNFSKDPYLSLIAQDILQKAQTFWEVIETHRVAYGKPPEDVFPDVPIPHHYIWYSTNAFYYFPTYLYSLSSTAKARTVPLATKNTSFYERIKSKFNRENTTPVAGKPLNLFQVDELHQRAKKATLVIEDLINNSSSYVKLFLQSPQLLKLSVGLREKLDKLLTSTYHLVNNNYDQLTSKLCLPFLLAADKQEQQLGLVVGSLSRPLQLILNAFFKEFLHGLNIESNTHINLVSNLFAIKQRQAVVNKTLARIDKHLAKIEKKLQPIKQLQEALASYENVTDPKLPASPLVIELATTQLITCYHKNRLHPNENLLRVKPLVTTMHGQLMQRKNTLLLQKSAIMETQTYLAKMLTEQKIENRRYLVNYLSDLFNQQVDLFKNQPIGLRHTQDEYSKGLEDNLVKQKNAIINDALCSADINGTLITLLDSKRAAYEKENFNSYLQLNRIRSALGEFENYFDVAALNIKNKRFSFEDEDTLQKKSEQIDLLTKIAKKGKIPISDRISQIQKAITNPTFKNILFKHKSINSKSYHLYTYLNWLWQSLVSIVYPHHSLNEQGCLNQLRSSLSKPQQHSWLIFFSNAPKPASLPLPAGNQPILHSTP